MFEGLNPADLAKYSFYELDQVIHIDWHAVRDEAIRRADKASKKIARLRKQLADAETELRRAGDTYNTALRSN